MYMPRRIHVVIDDREHEAFRAQAATDGVSLSEWLRASARERLQRGRPHVIATVKDLDRFFGELAVDPGREPDWQQHADVMDQSRRGGLRPT
jgi:hypothetical protein